MLNEEVDKFLDLITRRWLSDTPLSPDELMQLNDLHNRGLIGPEMYEAIHNQVVDKDLLDEGAYLENAQPGEYERLRRMINPETRVIPITGGKRVILIAVSVAAAFLIIAGLEIFRNSGGANKIDARSTPAMSEQEIPPAIKGATLKLADGSLVTLDSTGAGVVADQGGNRVSKLQGGVLAYLHSGKNDNSPGINTLFNTLTTSQGHRFRVDLPDGSKVWLNAASSLTYFAQLGDNNKVRRVELTGEAYFEIVPMRSVPFIVRANGTTTTVLGTHFNVQAYEENSRVAITLLQGSVRVNKGEQSEILHPGQEAISKTGSDLLQLDKEVDTAMVTSWKQGIFAFREPLGQIMQELARWYDVKVIMHGNADRRVAARGSREQPLRNILDNLEKIHAGHFTVKDRTIVVEP
ncbi:MAG: FecR domain-containing protein [Puia sp.]|nr:FecR domain-containing protein [Puia sp.]